MGDRDGDDHKLHILDFAKNAIVADPVAPEASKVVAESFAKRTRICGGSDSQLKISEDLPLDRGVKFGQVALESTSGLNDPG